MHEPRAKACACGLDVGDAVAQIECELVAGPDAASDEGPREIVHPPRRGSPFDATVVVNECRCVRTHGLRDGVEQIAVIPRHVFPPVLVFNSSWACAVAAGLPILSREGRPLARGSKAGWPNTDWPFQPQSSGQA